MIPLLVVDDDLTFARILESFLGRKGYAVDVCHNVKESLAVLHNKPYALHLLDYRLPDGTGLDIMNAAHSNGIKAPSIIMTSFNDVRTAVKAMHSGAFDYITKPVNQEELLMLIEQAIEKKEAVTEVTDTIRVPDFVAGESPESKRLHEQIRLIAPTDMSVIIHGESGTGKENVARLIHTLSERAQKPFIAVDCGTLSSELAASELFGHMKGAFTGALQNKVGKFEDANGGTLFLDEIGNLGYDVQVKLLRALQERVVTPIGGNKEVRIDIRVIVATNEDLNSSIGLGKFREDLYHRLNEFKIIVPPLRKRGSDIQLFVDHFIRESNSALKRNVQRLSHEVMDVFRKYDWPGNIRELKNIVKRLVLLAKGETAMKEDLPEEMLLDMERPVYLNEGTDLKALQESKEREMILQILEETKHNKSKAARLLNIDRSTLYAKMQKYNIG